MSSAAGASGSTNPATTTAGQNAGGAQAPAAGAAVGAGQSASHAGSGSGTGHSGGSSTNDSQNGASPTQNGASPAAGAANGQGNFAAGLAQPSNAPAQTVANHASPAFSSAFVRHPVPLADAIDTIRATFTAANQAGISSAKISLAPASLGGITISLSQTPDGLIARVIADHPEALQTLQQNAGELRQSLQQSGMNLLHLDIGQNGNQSLGSTPNFGHGGSGQRNPGGYPTHISPTEDETPTVTHTTLRMNTGSLVNVLA